MSQTPSPRDLPTPELLKDQFLQWMRMRNCSQRTIEVWEVNLRRFNSWCAQRGIECVTAVTHDVLAAYRRWLFHYRNPKTQAPLKFATQASYLISIRRWFVWLAKEQFIARDVTADLELPKEERRLPPAVLTADEVERVLNQTDLSKPLGLRDRALLETFYSTGMRCAELRALQVHDVEAERRVVIIRQGKGHKDRVVPIGSRALSWVAKYTVEVRPTFVWRTNETTLFVSLRGRPLGRTNVSAIVKGYLLRAGITKRGACHLLRHTAATLMMENGADLRSLQEFLGHERVNTTQVYTHVSIQRLKEVHERTHPAKERRERGDQRCEEGGGRATSDAREEEGNQATSDSDASE
jgi:integrase/recombinase XerD